MPEDIQTNMTVQTNPNSETAIQQLEASSTVIKSALEDELTTHQEQSTLKVVEFELDAVKKALEQGETAKKLVQEARERAEIASREAEQARNKAEKSRQLAEKARTEAEKSRNLTEAEQVKATSAKKLAEEARAHLLLTVTELNLALETAQHMMQIAQKGQEKAEIAEKRYRMVMEGSNSGLWDWDLLTDTIYWNGRFFKMLGLVETCTEPTREYLWSLVHPDDQSKLQQVIQAVLTHGQHFEKVFRLRHQTGRYVHCECRGQTVFDEQGQAIRVSGTIMDITARVESEAEIRHYSNQQDFLAQIGLHSLSGNHLSQIALNCAKLITQAMDVSYLKLLAWFPKTKVLRYLTVIGWDPILIGQEFPAQDESLAFAAYALSRKESISVIDAKQETRFAFYPKGSGMVSGVSIPIPGGQDADPLGCLELTTLEQRSFTPVEIKFLQSVANILSLVLQREKAEAMRKLYLLKLEQSNKDLDRFAVATSQELQNPLRKIKAFAKYLQSDMSDEMNADYVDDLQRMHRSIDSMQLLIDDLLALSRLSKGLGMANLESVNLMELLKKVKVGLHEEIRQKQAQVDIQVSCTVKGDPDQLYLLFENLLQNALKFQLPGSTPRITMTSTVLGDLGCEIAVEDNGIGFDDSEAERIFGIFEHLNRKIDYPGSGVGLAICRRIVERHNGTITATALPGKGAKFIVRLPLFNCKLVEANAAEILER